MKKSFLILPSLIIILFDSCTKYDDGPRITFRGAYKRISGIWQVNTYEVDGIDSLSLYNQVSNYSTIEIMLHNSSPEINDFVMRNSTGIIFHVGWIRIFENKNSYLISC